jgi:DNA-binding IclR family transcriptional regulator
MRLKSVTIPEDILYDPWLSHSAFRVWGCFAAHSDGEWETTITATEVASLLGCHVATINRAIADLTKAGYLERLGEGNSSHRRLVTRQLVTL